MRKIAYAIRAVAQKKRDVRLRERIWADAKRDKVKCPFKRNRGFCFDDPECLDCPCLYDSCHKDTQKRLLSILYGFQKVIGVLEGYENPKDNSDFLYLDQEEFDQEWLNDKHESIRKAANHIIQGQVDPESLHPNTLTYFRNCFPEWVEYEALLVKENLWEGLIEFHQRELKRVCDWPEPGGYIQDSDEDEDKLRDKIESLIYVNDWRGFPPEDLINNSFCVPRNVIKHFVRDYFQWRESSLNKEKEVVKKLCYLGKKGDAEEWPRKWMLSNKKIRNFLETKKGRFFIALVKYLETNKMNMRTSEKVAKELKHGDKKYVVVQVDRERAAEDLAKDKTLTNISCSALKINRFLKWMCDHGLIIRLGKPGSNSYSCYAIGKWFSFPDSLTGDMKPGGCSFFIQEKKKQELLEAIKSQIC